MRDPVQIGAAFFLAITILFVIVVAPHVFTQGVTIVPL